MVESPRELRLQGVEFLHAGVFDVETITVRREAAPGSRGRAREAAESREAEQPFRLHVANFHATGCGTVSQEIVEIDVFAVPRPRGKGNVSTFRGPSYAERSKRAARVRSDEVAAGVGTVCAGVTVRRAKGKSFSASVSAD